MEKQKNNNWFYVLITVIGLFLVIFITVALKPPKVALKPPKVSEWKEVTVVSRSELIVPCGFGSETEVTLVFSDGSTWRGYPSSASTNERYLLYTQEGDVACYRYNSYYITGKQWVEP